MIFESKLLKLKGERELTNSEIVRRSGIAPLSLTGFEKGTSTPSVPTLNRIACALNLDLKISFSPKGAAPEEKTTASSHRRGRCLQLLYGRSADHDCLPS